MTTKRLAAAVTFAAAALLMSACATAPEPVAEVPAPELTSQDLDVNQNITTFKLNYTGVLKSQVPATLERSKWELVVEGKVIKSGEDALNLAIPAGGTATFTLQNEAKYVSSPEELKALSEKGGSLLAALRGTLFVKAGGKTMEVPFARSRDIRTPRLPSVKMQELDAARYSDVEANIIFRLGVVNPNPFPLKIETLDYKIEVAGKQIAEGSEARGDGINPAATGVFEVQKSVNEQTHGKEIKQLVKGQLLPYVITGELRGDLFTVPVRLEGAVKLNVSK